MSLNQTAVRIARLRNRLGLTQHAFAQQVGVIFGPLVAGWESGQRRYKPGARALVKLGNFAAANGCTADAWFFWTAAGLRFPGLTRLEVEDGIRRAKALQKAYQNYMAKLNSLVAGAR